jgi:iron complex transport system substrate-binding protein
MRILSLHPSTTELAFALGAGNMLVGRTDLCTYPEAAEHVPSIGDSASITAETVATFAPDLILLGHDQENLKEAHGATSVLVLAPETLQEFITKLSSWGEALGKEVEAELLAHELQSLCDAIKAKAKRFVKTKTYLEQEQRLAPPAFIDDMISITGGEPARATQSPQIIVAAGREEEYAEHIAGRKGWEDFAAVKHERVFFVEESWLQPTPRSALGLKLLAKIMHGIEIRVDPE